MSLAFYLGRSGSGKTTAILREIEENVRNNPHGRPIIYLVPEQMTFQSEYRLVSMLKGGTIRAQVFSFTRLAWRILQETGGGARFHLQRSGIHMLLRKIVEQEKERLIVFHQAADTNGFIEQLEEMITELERYLVRPETLEEKRAQLLNKETLTPQEMVFKDKLHDMALIYRRFEAEMEKGYVTAEDMLQMLAEKIPVSTYLQGAQVYVDGFHSFTPCELAVLEQLWQTAHQVTIALTLDQPYTEGPPPELDLFHTTGLTYYTLCKLCRETGCPLEEPVIFEHGRRYANASLAYLEQSLAVNRYQQTEAGQTEAGQAVQIFEAVHRRAEVEAVAMEIVRLVRDDGYRYRDFALLMRNLDDYADLLQTVFTDFNIPLFMDKKDAMLNHPVIELIRSALDVINGNWRYEAVVRCLKTDLLFPVEADLAAMREHADQLENDALAYGIQGKRWYEQNAWSFRTLRDSNDGTDALSAPERAVEEKLDRLRLEWMAPLVRLEKRIKSSTTVRAWCEALYLFLDELSVPQKIEKMRDQAAREGHLKASREHDQVWGAVIDLLDQMVELGGDESLSFDLFRRTLETGMESMRFALVPPAIDQVIAADMDRSRLSEVRMTFILGANDGILPAKPKEDGMMNEEERQWLDNEGVQLAPGHTRRLLDEQFLLYLAQASPSERLYYSYPLADEEGDPLQPSMLIKQVQERFSDLQETFVSNDPQATPAPKQLDYIGAPVKTLSYLAVQLQTWKQGEAVEPFWWDVYNWFVTHAHWRVPTEQVLSSLFYTNEAQSIGEERSRELYGKTMLASVSRMERFQACSFSHFAAYGLRLRERETYRLEAPDIGQLFHAALKEMGERLHHEKKDWADLARDDCRRLAREVVRDLAPLVQKEILFSSHRHQYLKQKLEEVVIRAAFALSKQAKASSFVPVGLEVGFGPGAELPALRFTLNNGSEMALVGRIDRVDKADGENGPLLRIIDYKSSEKDIRLADVYFGLSLQLLLYLDIVISFAEEWLGRQASPAGALYFHVHNPIVEASRQMSMAEIEAELFKKFKMKGLLTADEESVRLMDATLSSGHSHIVPVGLKKNGGFYAHSAVIAKNDLDILRFYLRRLVKQIGEAMVSGSVEINPYKLKQRTPCTYCPYRPVCQFDPTLETNAYRLLHEEKDDVILEKIRRKSGEQDEHKTETRRQHMDG